MKVLILISAFCLFVATAIADSPTSDRCQFGLSEAKDAAKAVGNLAVQLYQKVVKPDSNAIFSPVSISLALALVESGAAGDTKTEIQRFLGPPGSNQQQSLQRQLQIQTDKVRVSIANGFFYAEILNLKDDYVNQVKQCFDTEITKEPFATDADGARQKINQWVSNKTAEKIPELFKSGSITPDTAAVIANAIYLKAAWADRFEQTENRAFYKSGQTNQAQTVPFMLRTDKYGYASKDNFDAVEIRYDGVQLSMFVLLPKQRDGIKSLEQSLTGEQLISLFGEMDRRQVELKLPKFTIRQSIDLKEVLQQLGIQKMFSDEANFSRMTTDDIKVSGAVHEAYIKVNENGTEAAAATGFKMVFLSASMPDPEPVSFIADHPFIYAIVHKPTSAIAFIGKVNSVE